MFKKKLFLITICCAFLIANSDLKGQDNIKDTKQLFPGFMGSMAFEVPGGNLAKRFGVNGNLGGSFFLKTSSNYFFTVEGSFIFGSKIKDDSLFRFIKTSGGYIIDGDGMYADIRTYERGYTIMGKAGKIFPILNDNPNSGLLVMLGGGFMQHKIRIENPGNAVPHLKGDYKKGYDKLSNGPALSQFIGYIHFSDKRIYNFKAGFEFTQAITTSRRNYDFDLIGRDTKKYIDLLYGFKVSWMFPFVKRKPADFYYY